MNVNLLPASFRLWLAIRRQAWRWTIVVVLLSLAGGGLLAAQYVDLLAERQDAGTTALRSQNLRAVESQIKQLREQANSLQATIQSLQQSEPQDRTLTLIGIVSQVAAALDGKLHVKQLSVQMAPPIAASPANAAPAPPGRSGVAASGQPPTPNDLLIEGTAENAAVIADLIQALHDTHVFTRVELTATSEASTAAGTVRLFRVDCQF